MKDNPNLTVLQPLIGAWSVELKTPQGVMKGKATFSWVEGKSFVCIRTQIKGGPPRSSMQVGRDEASPDFVAFYYDERGVARIYQMSFDGRTWKLWRDHPGFRQRFSAEVDGPLIKGAWDIKRRYVASRLRDDLPEIGRISVSVRF